MNYYEQFYDDLEFCDAEDDLSRYNDPYYRDDPNYDNDPYQEDTRFYRDSERDRYYSQQGHGHFPQDRLVPHSRGGGRSERGHERADHGRGHGPPRGRGRSGRGYRSDENLGGRGMNRGRGNIPRGNQRGGLKTMTFVKASASNTASSSDQTPQQATGDQIRFDYKNYQNQRPESEVEEEQALKAYGCHLGFGYGYGPRSDLIEGDQPEWLIGPEVENQTEGQGPGEGLPPTETESTENQEANMNVKTAMVSPAFNFVKAKSEFHSIDVAFHETEEAKEIKPKPNSLSVNYGNKRVGLGFGVSANKASAPTVDISASFYAGMKDGSNPRVDAKFAKLQEAVKARSLPNKNAIEILHMAVDRVKMAISDEITASSRTPTGQPMFLCRLEVDGVSVAQGQATAKKAAKHEAYQNAVQVFANQALTVKEVSQGVFELRQKGVEFKTPDTVGLSTASGTGRKPHYVPGQKSQPGTSANSVAQNASFERNTTSQASLSSYSKPKIVFHQPSHPLNNKPLEFIKSEPSQSQTGSQNQSPSGSSPAALAMKLLNFVKEGAQSENQSSTSNAGTSSASGTSGVDHKTYLAQNSRKRSSGQSQNLNSGKLKVQKKGGGNVNHSIEDLSQFILIDSTPFNQTINELSVLHNSANFNRVVLKLEYENVPNGVRCSLVLSDIIVAISQGATKEDARRQVASDSLEYLRECCYTIRIKQAVDSDSSGLTKEQLLSDIQKAGEAGGGGVIPDSNIGNMLLRKMGWVGGGCGKDGTGIAEPVKAEMVIGREGLGLKAEKGIGKNFHQRVTKMLQDYIKSDEQTDLYFSSELSKDERAIIHNIGQKLGLKTHSKGKDENRYLIVSRKRNAQQLLEHVRESGGSTSKYELIPPGDPDLDLMRREDIWHGHCKQ